MSVHNQIKVINYQKLTQPTGIQTDWGLYSWFSTSFDVSSEWKNDKVLLNFGAVDYEATVFVNGQKAGFHRGGYYRFALDVTEHVKFDQSNELCVIQPKKIKMAA